MKRLAVNLAIMISSFLLTILALEAAIRVLAPQPFYVVRGSTLPFIEYDPLLGWKNIRFSRVPHKAGPRDPSVMVRINGMGFRGPEISKKARDGVRRVAIVGDSIAFGYGLAEEDTYAYMLQQDAGQGFEVINAAVIGYGTDQQYLMFEEYVKPLSPDVLVVGFSAGDVLDIMCSVNFGRHKPYFRYDNGLVGPEGVPVSREGVPFRSIFFSDSPVRSFLFDNSHLFRFFSYRISNPDSARDYDVRETDIETGYRIAAALAAALAESCAARGCEAVFVAVPPGDLRSDSSRIFYEQAVSAIRESGVRLIDLWPAFYERRSEGLFLEGDPLHPNRRGNRIIADSLLPWLGPKGDMH